MSPIDSWVVIPFVSARVGPVAYPGPSIGGKVYSFPGQGVRTYLESISFISFGDGVSLACRKTPFFAGS